MELMRSYSGKKVLVTGHTGFKGSWLSAWLHTMGAEVHGVALDPPSSPSHYDVAGLGSVLQDRRIDIQDENAIVQLVKDLQPDFVFHLAAQALVRPSYESPLDTMRINAIGSATILEALRGLSRPVVAIMITSDKAYDNAEWVWGYRETDRLGGKDPYSASKGMAELAIRSYVESYFSAPNSNLRLGIARAGNVIGGGDWAVDRIVPDCMRSWSQGDVVDIRNPWATRPWQHVLEPLSGYLLLGAVLSENTDFHGEAYNFGPSAEQNRSVSELIDEMEKTWSQVRWNDISQEKNYLHESGLLKLNCDKALSELSWKPTLTFEDTVRMTVEWYKHYYQDVDVNNVSSMIDFTVNQIEGYIQLAVNRGNTWIL
jgi:CDP-glucose 4,6-dehydratase